MLVGIGVKLGVADGGCVAGRVGCVVGRVVATMAFSDATDSFVGVNVGKVVVQPTKTREMLITSIFTVNENFPLFIITSFGYQRPIAISTV